MSVEKFQALVDRGLVLTTETDNLVNNANSALGPQFDNTTNRDRYGYALLTLGNLSGPPPDGATVELFAVPAPDGTNYVDGGGANDPSGYTCVGSFILRPVGGVQVVLSQRFELLPCKMKFMIRNMTSATFFSNGTTVRLFTTNREVV